MKPERRVVVCLNPSLSFPSLPCFPSFPLSPHPPLPSGEKDKPRREIKKSNFVLLLPPPVLYAFVWCLCVPDWCRMHLCVVCVSLVDVVCVCVVLPVRVCVRGEVRG